MFKKGNAEAFHAGAFIVGVGASLIVGIAGIAVLSALVINGRVGETHTPWIAVIWLFLSMFSGGLLSALAHQVEHSYFPIAVAATGVLILLLSGLLFFEGSLQNPLLRIGAAIAGGITASLVHRKSRQPAKRRKYRYR